MMVVLSFEEMRYLLLGLFDDLVNPCRIYICDIKFLDLVVCFNLVIARKGAMAFHKVI